MQKTLRLLAILLGAQLLLALGLSHSGPQLSTGDNGKPLLQVAARQTINHITLEGPDHAKVTLIKKGGGWQLPDAYNFPADEQRIGRLLDRLTTLRPSLPVASTQGARDRFKVSDDHFERRITLADSGEKLATLYLGSSPGRNRIHVRLAGQDDIRTLKLAAYEIPVETADWEKKNILQLPKEKISAIKVDGLQLQWHKPKWKVSGLKAGEAIKSGAADKLAGMLANLRIGEVLGNTQKAAYGLDKPALTLTLTRKDGKQVNYLLGKQPDKDRYTLKVSTLPEYFRIPSFTARPLIETAGQRDKLIRTAASTSPADQNTTKPTQGAS